MEWTPAITLRIFTACLGFTELFPSDIGAAKYAEITHRKLCLHYLCTNMCINIARLDETIEGQLQHYVFTRGHVEGFRKVYTDWEGRSEEESKDMREKFDKLLPFDFEGATKLKLWDELDQLVDEAILLDAQNSFALEYIADIVMCATTPQTTALNVLHRIVEHKITVQYNDMQKLATWIRWLIQFSLSRDASIVETLLTQAIELAKCADPDNRYSEAELEWLIGE